MILKLVLHLICFLWLTEPLAAAPSMAKPGCQASCGNVTIPYPFGIGNEHCYHEKWYQITCNESVNPPKPFLSRFNLEVLSISLQGQHMTVNVPVAPICKGSPWTSANLTGSPFRFSRANRFTVRGCGNAIFSQGDEILGGCTSICDSNIASKGCYGINCCETSIPSGLATYNITTRDTATGNCAYAFLSELDYPPIPGQVLNSFSPVRLEWMITSLENLPGRRYPNQFCYQQMTWASGVQTYSCQCSSHYEGNGYIPHGCEVVESCAHCKGRCMMKPRTSTSHDPEEYYCHNKTAAKAVILGVSIGGGSLFLLLGSFWFYKVMMENIELKEKFSRRNDGLLLQQF